MEAQCLWVSGLSFEGCTDCHPVDCLTILGVKVYSEEAAIFTASNSCYAVTMADQLFQEWQVYQKLVTHDYMHHAALFGRLAQEISSRFERPVSILDLGCGDLTPVRLRGRPPGAVRR